MQFSTSNRSEVWDRCSSIVEKFEHTNYAVRTPVHDPLKLVEVKFKRKQLVLNCSTLDTRGGLGKMNRMRKENLVLI
jgi:hypothetical protein